MDMIIETRTFFSDIFRQIPVTGPDMIQLPEQFHRIFHRTQTGIRSKERPCLYYHIKQCKAPCQGYISQEEYRRQIDSVLDFLNGNYKKLLKELEEKMLTASEELRFEDAAECRDLMQSIQKIGERQKITGSQGEDKDVIALASDEEDAVAQVHLGIREQPPKAEVQYREGKPAVIRQNQGPEMRLQQIPKLRPQQMQLEKKWRRRLQQPRTKTEM